MTAIAALQPRNNPPAFFCPNVWHRMGEEKARDPLDLRMNTCFVLKTPRGYQVIPGVKLITKLFSWTTRLVPLAIPGVKLITKLFSWTTRLVLLAILFGVFAFLALFVYFLIGRS